MDIIVDFFISCIVYIVALASVVYLLFSMLTVIDSRKTGERYHFEPKAFITMLIVLGFSVYYLLLGQAT